MLSVRVERSMFGIPELDSFYRKLKAECRDCGDFLEAATLAEEWLLRFSTKKFPIASAKRKIASLGSKKGDEELMFAIGMALCIPSNDTRAIINSFYPFLKDNAFDTARYVKQLAKHAQGEIEVDVLLAVSLVNDSSLCDLTCRLYGSTVDDVRLHAVAWDDLKSFNLTLSDHEPSARYQAAYALARFPVAPETRIHQQLSLLETFKLDFPYYRSGVLRSQLEGEYTSGVDYVRFEGVQRATLRPQGGDEIERAKPGQFKGLHEEPGFSLDLTENMEEIIHEFFEVKREECRIKPNSWRLVDEITRAFMAAGADAKALVALGPCSQEDLDTLPSLKEALSALGELSVDWQRFYQVMYRAYLSGFDHAEVVANCENDETLAAVYRVTNDKAYLQAGNAHVRSIAISADLGL
ncbi:hypothetical protein PLA107_030565 (plasmid) [Pseudomonas amygdali pv. lachrymans str. M301315]|uniref:Uncharacterized protein n=2 Tax=Pseudomonas amygdali pv. lachrymans TaxID=53707 RepID=A0AAD0M674_PSEAV|nr:hypothetical protein PLA107_030565 [Pseudomonas amygdali pv. lachrymans str. M301315]